MQKLVSKFIRSGFRFYPNYELYADGEIDYKSHPQSSSQSLQNVKLYLIIIKPSVPVEIVSSSSLTTTTTTTTEENETDVELDDSTVHPETILISKAKREMEKQQLLKILKPPPSFKIISLSNIDINKYQQNQILIKSCPFSLSNPVLFSDYHSNGNISYLIKSNNHEQIDAILSDIRYLDNMEGGIVFLDSSNEPESLNNDLYSIGMVGGSFKKLNGQGDLLLIITWDLILNILQSIFLSDGKLSLTKIKELTINNDELNELRIHPRAPFPYVGNPIQFQPPITKIKTSSFIESNNSNLQKKFEKEQQQLIDNYNPIQSIVSITIETFNSVCWGSGILLSDTIVVTNRHVINNYDKSSITIWFSNSKSSRIFDIIKPISDFDLVYLQLIEKCPINYNKPAKLCKRSILKGEKVKSIGFGLFYPLINPMQLSTDLQRREGEEINDGKLNLNLNPMDFLQPLISQGVISTLISLPLFPPNTKNMIQNPNLPIMAISSAGCWNGSSGGGLFNSNNELIAMLTSNGKLESTGEILPFLSLGIPIYGIIDYGFNLINAKNNLGLNVCIYDDKEIKINSDIKKCWDLKPTHKEVVWRKEIGYKL